MAESLGQRLKHARIKKGLTLEDVARATKIRVPRLRDLEADDFSNFSSLVYARGFLKNYATFLGIDVSDTLERLAAASDIDPESYQYLSHDHVLNEKAKRRPPSKLPKLLLSLFFIILVVMLLVGGLFISSALRRLYPGTFNTSQKFIGVDSESPQAESFTPQPAEDKPQQLQNIVNGTATATLADLTKEPARVENAQVAELEEDTTPVMRAIPVGQMPAPAARNLPTYEISIQPVERSWVKIIRDDPDAPPVFEDYLSPGDNPLVFTGSKFWITVMERDAIVVRRNGVPVVFEGTALIIE